MGGAAQEFLFDDASEDPVVKAQFGIGDATTTAFQLSRPIGSFSDPIQNVNGNPVNAPIWTPTTAFGHGDIVIPTDRTIMASGTRPTSVQFPGWPCFYAKGTSGTDTSGDTEPDWRGLAPQFNNHVLDGTVLWTNRGPAFVVYVDGTAQDPSTYSLGSTGIVTFTSPPGMDSILTWTGCFYYRCRFQQDSYEFEEFQNNFHALRKVELISVLL